MAFFWYNYSDQIRYTEEDLNKFLKNVDFKNNSFLFSDPIWGYLTILSLVLNDADVKIEYLNEKEYRINFSLEHNIKKTPDLDLFYLKNILNYQNSKGTLALSTSGTTGKPKEVLFKLINFIQTISSSDRHTNDKWLLTYLPFHTAGLQVFFQAFFSNSPIIYLSLQQPELFATAITEFSINRLSMTPSFYRLTSSGFFNKKFENVTSISFGGEVVDDDIFQSARIHFPNATVRSIYALTETGSLMTSQNGIFSFTEKMKSYIKISVDNEILVHQSHLGKMEIQDEWYNTGDIVYFVDPTKFKIIGRHSEFINVGGYKVNPQTVEKVIREIPFVKSASVSSKKNSLLGSIVVASVTLKSDSTIPENPKQILMQHCQSRLQKQEVPVQFFIVEKLDVTSTGKIKRI